MPVGQSAAAGEVESYGRKARKYIWMCFTRPVQASSECKYTLETKFRWIWIGKGHVIGGYLPMGKTTVASQYIAFRLVHMTFLETIDR